MGALIDQFDSVIRFNNIDNEGYERDVGKRTDVWCHYEGNHPAEQHPSLEKMTLHEGCSIEFRGERLSAFAQERVFGVIKYPDGLYPTTGTVCLSWLLDFFSPIYTIGWFQTVDLNHWAQHYNHESGFHQGQHHSPVHDKMYADLLESQGVITQIRV